MAAVDNDRVGGEVVGRSRQKVVEDAGAEAGAVRVDGRPVETHHLDQWRDLVRVSDPAVDITQRLLQLRDLIKHLERKLNWWGCWWTNRPSPGVDPGEGGQTGENVLPQIQDVEAPG